MSTDMLIRRLRPALSPRFQCLQKYRSTRAFITSQVQCRDTKRPAPSDITHDYEKRVAQLNQYLSEDQWYPRLARNVGSKSIEQSMLQSQYGHLNPGETGDEHEYTIAGTYSIVYRFTPMLVLTFCARSDQEYSYGRIQARVH